MKTLFIVGLLLVQAFTCVQLIQTRQQLNTIVQDVAEHDGMLEGLGDDLTNLEQVVSR